MWGIEFQTPAEEIYTQAFIKARATLRVFQTPTEKFILMVEGIIAKFL